MIIGERTRYAQRTSVHLRGTDARGNRLATCDERVPRWARRRRDAIMVLPGFVCEARDPRATWPRAPLTNNSRPPVRSESIDGRAACAYESYRTRRTTNGTRGLESKMCCTVCIEMRPREKQIPSVSNVRAVSVFK